MPAGGNPYVNAAEQLHAALRAVAGIATMHQLPVRLPNTSHYRQDTNAYVLLAQLTSAAGTLARIFQPNADPSVGYGSSNPGEVRLAVDLVMVRALVLAEHYALGNSLRTSIETHYRDYQRNGYISD